MPVAGATATGAGASSTEIEYGCVTCDVKFDSSASQRAHMREDWHIHNLRRRVESLPRLSEAEFRVQSPSSPKKTSDTEDSFQKSCNACEQHYTSRRAWQAHLKSRFHIEKNAAFHSNAPKLKEGQSSEEEEENDDDDEEEEEEEEEEFSPDQCLFCNLESTSLEANLTHMSQAHSFFIPDIDSLIDVESLISYLFAVVSVFRECLFCAKPKNTRLGVQDHMRGKGHCKLNLETDEHHLGQFYDSSKADEQDDEKEPGEEVRLAPVEEGELLLPSGKVLGRRSQTRSGHPPNPKRSPAAPSSQQQQQQQQQQQDSTGKEIDRATTPPTIPMESQDRTIVMRKGTSTSLIGLPESQRRALVAIEMKMEKMEARARNEYRFKVERGGNRQKRYKVASIGKKAGGLEKRLG